MTHLCWSHLSVKGWTRFSYWLLSQSKQDMTVTEHFLSVGTFKHVFQFSSFPSILFYYSFNYHVRVWYAGFVLWSMILTDVVKQKLPSGNICVWQDPSQHRSPTNCFQHSHHTPGCHPWRAGCCHVEAGTEWPSGPPGSQLALNLCLVLNPILASCPAEAGCIYWCAGLVSAGMMTGPSYPPAAAVSAIKVPKYHLSKIGVWRFFCLFVRFIKQPHWGAWL